MFLPILTFRQIARFYASPSTLRHADTELEETFFAACEPVEIPIAAIEPDNPAGFAQAA